MNALIDVVLKVSGLGWLWDAVDGKKTYIAAFLGFLTGAVGLANEIVPPLLAHNGAALLDVVKNLPHDQSWLAIVAAVGALGIGHKVEKASAPPSAPPPAA